MFSYRIDENLKLILPQKHHAKELLIVVRENLDILKPWMPWATDDYSIDSALDFINRNLKEFAETGTFSASIALDEKIVGQVGFHHLDATNKHAEIGYWLARDAHGRGIVTRCTRVLIDYLFDDFGLNRVQINCNVENKSSRAIPERLGFALEGFRRQVEFNKGKFGDWAIYAMLREDWKK
jgi:ribosomal-protein-serine acetyltransferase